MNLLSACQGATPSRKIQYHGDIKFLTQSQLFCMERVNEFMRCYIFTFEFDQNPTFNRVESRETIEADW